MLEQTLQIGYGHPSCSLRNEQPLIGTGAGDTRHCDELGGEGVPATEDKESVMNPL